MNRRVVGSLCLISFVATGCIVSEDKKVGVQIGGALATKFVHRGMIQSENGVFQPRLAVTLPTVTDDTIKLVSAANMDLSDDNGDAWFPRGHGGRFSQIDFIGSYVKQLDDVFTVEAGLFNYNLPNGLEFATDGQGGPGEERGATSEVFVRLSANVLEATPYVSWHYDIDEVRGAYYRVGIQETFQINNEWGVLLDGSLGYASSAQADWLYDLDQSGFADLRGKAELLWQYDPRTTIIGGVHGSAIVDSTLDSWFNDVGVFDDDPIWFSLGVNWKF